ncbi:MAG: MFS transporter, partial [Candidatus Eisenbacteria bacterium]
ASFMVILFALVAMAPIPRTSEPKHSVLRSVAEGMRYVKANRRVAWLLSLTAVALFCTGSFVALLPAVAGDLSFLGTSWLSLLLAAVGLGALVGSFALMHLGRSRYVGRIYAGAALFNGLAVVFFALSLQPGYALLTAFAAGLAGTLMAGLTNTMLQGAITDEYRGRIMSIFSFMFIGLMPAGQLVLGAIGTPLGIHAALIAAGSVAFVVGLFGIVRVHVVRDWLQTPHAVAAPALRAPDHAAREGIPVRGGEAGGGLTPTYTLGEASALK